jgi:hypothetical protein
MAKSKLLLIRVSPFLRQRFYEVARCEKTTASEILRIFMREYILQERLHRQVADLIEPRTRVSQ